MVWMGLSGLPLEYWLLLMIMAITTKAGKPLAVDDFMDLLRKIGYARVRLEIGVGNPLKLGCFDQGKEGGLLVAVHVREPPDCMLLLWEDGPF